MMGCFVVVSIHGSVVLLDLLDGFGVPSTIPEPALTLLYPTRVVRGCFTGRLRIGGGGGVPMDPAKVYITN